MNRKGITSRVVARDEDALNYLLEDELEKNKHFLHECIETTHKVHHFYLSNEFEEPYRYSKMFHILASAPSDETMVLHINTIGGRLDTGVQLINNIRTSPAHIIAVIEGACHSLGVLVFLSADDFIVHENCIMMLHTSTSVIGGKTNEQERELKTSIKWFTDLSNELLVPFLTEIELKRMLAGEDFWMTTKEIRTRLKRVVKARKAKSEKHKS